MNASDLPFTLIKKITIIGVGLIGGSLAKAIKNNNLAKVVFGLESDATDYQVGKK